MGGRLRAKTLQRFPLLKQSEMLGRRYGFWDSKCFRQLPYPRLLKKVYRLYRR